MAHSFTVTTDTDVLIWHNESQFSFPHKDSNTSSEKNFNVLKKMYTMLIQISYIFIITF